MFRLSVFLFAALLGFGPIAAPAGAAPQSYDIFCTGNLAPRPPVTVDGIPMNAFGFETEKKPFGTDNVEGVCGWFTRAWRAGEPAQLCISASELRLIEAAGAANVVQYGGWLELPSVWSFAVYNNFAGCMVVTGFASNESHAFAPTHLICKVAPAQDQNYAGYLAVYDIRNACTDLNGAPLPPSGSVCGDKYLGGLKFPAGSFGLSVIPWWPCGLATVEPLPPSPPPTAALYTPLPAYELTIPISISIPVSSYHPPYSVRCEIDYPNPTSTSRIYSFGSAEVTTRATGFTGTSSQSVTLNLSGDNTLPFPPQPKLNYACDLEAGAPSNGPPRPTVVGGSSSVVKNSGSFDPTTASPIITSPLIFKLP